MEKDYPVTAQAVGSSEVVGWDRETMLALLTAYPPIAINVLGVVVERLYDTRSRYLELQTGRVEQRVARAFLRIMKQAGRKTDEAILIEFRLSRLHQHHPVHRKPHPIIHLCISYFALAQRHKPLYGID